MKASEYRAFYLSFVNLYGCIHSDDAYEIIKMFNPKFLKKDLYKDLKERVNKQTRGFQVIRTTNNKYVICDTTYDFEILDRLFEAQGSKPFFIPDTLEDLLAFKEEFYMDNEEVLEPLQEYFDKVLNDEKKDYKLFLPYYCYVIIKNGGSKENVKKAFDALNYKIDEKFDALYDQLADNTRLLSNRGFTNNELKELEEEEPANA